jgi:hypothetical protein
MPSKRIVISLLLILCFSSNVFCQTIKIETAALNGTWMPDHSYLWIISNPEEERSDYSVKKFSWGNAKRIPNTTLEIDITSMTYFDPGFAGYSIKEYNQIDNTTFKVQIYRQVFPDMPESFDELEIVLHFLNEDSFWIESEAYKNIGSTFDKDAVYYRLSGQNVMSQPACINDSRVRIRVQPNLQSDTWGFLNKGEKVTVIDKSKDKQKIGDMENFWYKVDVSYYPDGWVYGEYITFE